MARKDVVHQRLSLRNHSFDDVRNRGADGVQACNDIRGPMSINVDTLWRSQHLIHRNPKIAFPHSVQAFDEVDMVACDFIELLRITRSRDILHVRPLGTLPPPSLGRSWRDTSLFTTERAADLTAVAKISEQHLEHQVRDIAVAIVVRAATTGRTPARRGGRVPQGAGNPPLRGGSQCGKPGLLGSGSGRRDGELVHLGERTGGSDRPRQTWRVSDGAHLSDGQRGQRRLARCALPVPRVGYISILIPAGCHFRAWLSAPWPQHASMIPTGCH